MYMYYMFQLLSAMKSVTQISAFSCLITYLQNPKIDQGCEQERDCTNSPQGCRGYIVFSLHGFYPLNPIRSTVCIHIVLAAVSYELCNTNN